MKSDRCGANTLVYKDGSWPFASAAYNASQLADTLFGNETAEFGPLKSGLQICPTINDSDATFD
jgi:hypothetical protein